MGLMDSLDRELLKRAQDGMELRERPYRTLGERLGLSEEETIRRLEDLEKRHYPQGCGHHRSPGAGPSQPMP